MAELRSSGAWSLIRRQSLRRHRGRWIQNYGTVFKLTPSGGSWTESVLHSFCSATNCTDGLEPYGGVVLDAHNNIYGVTPEGGTLNLGVAYELSLKRRLMDRDHPPEFL